MSKPITLCASDVRELINGSLQEIVFIRALKPQSQMLNGSYSFLFNRWYPTTPSGKVGLEPPAKCPFGNKGDRLCIKERFDVIDRGTETGGAVATLIYLADGTERPMTQEEEQHFSLRPRTMRACWMPRSLSRLTLETTEVLVRRVGGKWFWFVTAKKI